METAKGWRAQIAADAGFQKILLDSQSAKPEAHWDTALPDGPYFLRLRAIDATGLEGLNTDHPFELAARPLPPELLTPGAGERSYRESVTFSWSAAENAKGYLLNVAPTPDFNASTTILRRLDPVNRQTERLAPGDYFWRMASLDEQGQPRGWSPVRSLRVQPLPGAPKAEARTDNGKTHFTWSASPDAANYELEVSHRYDFGASAQEARQQSAGTRASVALKPGKYYWRIRALEADGQAGAWSRTNSLTIPPEVPYEIRVSVREGVLNVNWQGTAPAFRLEFARDANFSIPLFNHLEEGNSTRLATPEPGQYWVRVIALSQTGARSGRSKPVSFTIRRWQ
jgi:hypothetical protein